MVIIWFFDPGYKSSARWERKRDLPEDGGEDKRVGRRREKWEARDWRAWVAVGVVIRVEVGVGGIGGPEARRRKTPCTFAISGLGKKPSQ